MKSESGRPVGACGCSAEAARGWYRFCFEGQQAGLVDGLQGGGVGKRMENYSEVLAEQMGGRWCCLQRWGPPGQEERGFRHRTDIQPLCTHHHQARG